MGKGEEAPKKSYILVRLISFGERKGRTPSFQKGKDEDGLHQENTGVCKDRQFLKW